MWLKPIILYYKQNILGNPDSDIFKFLFVLFFSNDITEFIYYVKAIIRSHRLMLIMTHFIIEMYDGLDKVYNIREIPI